MEREYFRQRLYVGRDLLISGRTGLKQCHLTPGSLPHHLCSPFHPSMHTHTHTQKPNEASRNGDSSKPRPWLHGSHCLPRVCLSKDTRFLRPHPTQVDGPVLWQLHVMDLKEVIWTSGGRGRVISDGSWFAQSHLVSRIFPRHSGVQSLLCFLQVLKEESTTLVLQLHQFLNMSLLKGLASSPKPHRPEQRGHSGDSQQEGTLWLGPSSAAVSRDGCWAPSSFHPSSADRSMSTTRLTQPHPLSFLLSRRQSQSTHCNTVIS